MLAGLGECPGQRLEPSSIASYLATDALKDSHREFRTVAHRQAVHPTLVIPRLDSTHLDSGIPERNQDARDATMPVGRDNREMTIPDVNCQHW
jgi:hypothetical protein